MTWVALWVLAQAPSCLEALCTEARAAYVSSDYERAERAVLEGDRDEALGTIRDFMSRPFDPEGCYFMARNLVRLKEHASALDLLERIVKEGFFVYQILQRDPWLDPIRAERRFNAIVASARERSQDAEAEFHRLGGDQLLA